MKKYAAEDPTKNGENNPSHEKNYGQLIGRYEMASLSLKVIDFIEKKQKTNN